MRVRAPPRRQAARRAPESTSIPARLPAPAGGFYLPCQAGCLEGYSRLCPGKVPWKFSPPLPERAGGESPPSEFAGLYTGGRRVMAGGGGPVAAPRGKAKKCQPVLWLAFFFARRPVPLGRPPSLSPVFFRHHQTGSYQMVATSIDRLSPPPHFFEKRI